MQQKHTSENAAREAARKLGNQFVYIIESRGDFFVEDDCGMVRLWERIVWQGAGKNARPNPKAKPSAAQMIEVNQRIGKAFAMLGL